MTYQQDLARLHKERIARIWRARPTIEPVPASKHCLAGFSMAGKATGRLMDVSLLGREIPLPAPMRLTITAIIDAVSKVHQIRHSEIVGRSRSYGIRAARFHAIWLARKLYPYRSLPMIGKQFNRDHTTILNAVRKWEKMAGKHQSEIAAVNAILFKDAEPMVG